ncbi:TetR family transcriptional regulator [Pseudonocardia sp. KRD-184]|uniref:TetR family transcriptional regulator n=1 Tax=Pseudonocardia oceani TaxID=2792013 RepID=A0ABS6UDV8_9PSEU|nr:TetR family transcriptional regulator [Pseudonocardia oceani]MBW0088176.1 TetR family transcriptional regulator [Pseudonocardia oceani]MBW0094815.1 TetR family transcriptional regulator [Pseudonocardia oceani]MBW0107593.1 TetR family transcriptional regulator [Pseudonocardia oceani]MBW0121024.1 TetR family transcriptional regulator [Pseudonocardia oceani]MBW0130437.1 TetR family transcriptional regulator [Pseudonocardia oceani]
MPPEGRAPERPDRRRRKGEARRRALLDAALRVVGREGASAVTQRAVAAEAGVPPTAVLYYFPTVDDLLVAALLDVNDRWVAAVDALPADREGALDGLAALVAGSAEHALAEYELCLLAARRPALRGELDRWWGSLDALARRLVRGADGEADADGDGDRAAATAFTAGVDGLLLRVSGGGLDPRRARAVLEALVGRPHR